MGVEAQAGEVEAWRALRRVERLDARVVLPRVVGVRK